MNTEMAGMHSRLVLMAVFSVISFHLLTGYAGTTSQKTKPDVYYADEEQEAKKKTLSPARRPRKDGREGGKNLRLGYRESNPELLS